MSDAGDRWYTRNVPKPRIAMVSPERIDALVDEFSRRNTIGVPDKSKGIKVLGMEVIPDRRVDPGIIVFVDENFKFVGATVLP